MRLRRARPGVRVAEGSRRLSGPAGEQRWWVPEDQAWAELPLLTDRDLGRGWRRVPMLNNVEVLDPYGSGAAADGIRDYRAARVLSALYEGAAWRRRNDPILAVARVEVFRERDDSGHRAAWQDLGAACMEATWRQRWEERGMTPGWIEARWLIGADRSKAWDVGEHGCEAESADGAVDWLVVEDHTGDGVDVYDHVTTWCGRLSFTLTVRHGPADDLRVPIRAACASVRRRAQETEPPPPEA